MALAKLLRVMPDMVSVTVTSIVAVMALFDPRLETDKTTALPPGKEGGPIEPPKKKPRLAANASA